MYILLINQYNTLEWSFDRNIVICNKLNDIQPNMVKTWLF